ncbi:MAG: hypothetical protein HYX68_00660 [Planctomycetes bacterium]|nr:hypothetical protein [Planctomycetota bacterium]
MADKKPEPIRFRCQCGKQLSAWPNQIGMLVQCASCDKKSRIPEKSKQPIDRPGLIQTILSSTCLSFAVASSLVGIAALVAVISVFVSSRPRHVPKTEDPKVTHALKKGPAIKESPVVGNDGGDSSQVIEKQWIDDKGLKHRAFGKIRNGEKHGVWLCQGCEVQGDLLGNKRVGPPSWNRFSYTSVDFWEGREEGRTILWNGKDVKAIYQVVDGKPHGVMWILPRAEAPNGLISFFKNGVSEGRRLDGSVLSAQQKKVFDMAIKQHRDILEQNMTIAPKFREWLDF